MCHRATGVDRAVRSSLPPGTRCATRLCAEPLEQIVERPPRYHESSAQPDGSDGPAGHEVVGQIAGDTQQTRRLRDAVGQTVAGSLSIVIGTRVLDDDDVRRPRSGRTARVELIAVPRCLPRTRTAPTNARRSAPVGLTARTAPTVPRRGRTHRAPCGISHALTSPAHSGNRGPRARASSMPRSSLPRGRVAMTHTAPKGIRR